MSCWLLQVKNTEQKKGSDGLTVRTTHLTLLPTEQPCLASSGWCQSTRSVGSKLVRMEVELVSSLCPVLPVRGVCAVRVPGAAHPHLCHHKGKCRNRPAGPAMDLTGCTCDISTSCNRQSERVFVTEVFVSPAFWLWLTRCWHLTAGRAAGYADDRCEREAVGPRRGQPA